MKDIAEMQRAARSHQVIKLPVAWRLMSILTGLVAILAVGSATVLLPSEPVFGLLSTIVAAAVVVGCLWMLYPGATFLLVEPDQLIQCVCFYRMTVRWKDVHNIRIGWPGGETAEITLNRQVIVDYSRNDQRLSMPIAPWAFGINADQLVSLLTPYYKQQYNAADTSNA